MHVQKFPRLEDKVHPAGRLCDYGTATAPPTGASRYRRPLIKHLNNVSASFQEKKKEYWRLRGHYKWVGNISWLNFTANVMSGSLK